MDAKNTIGQILRDATGKRASGRELLVAEKRSILSPGAAKALKEQWNGAGRDNAFVVMKLVDESGNNPHYVTGWDGKDTFVCMTESGLTYVPYRKLEKLRFVEDWNAQTRLIEVRTPLLQETMERSDVDMLLDRVKKTLVKSGKGRRKSRFRNLSKYFEDCSSKKAGPPSETEMEPLDKKDERVPAAKPHGLKKESFTWDTVTTDGSVVRRPLRHPMMKVEANTTEPQLDKRQQVTIRGEGGKGGSAAGGSGNKTEPQLDKRQQIDVRQESNGNKTQPQLDKRQQVDVRHEACTGCGCSGDKFVTYAGETGKCPECGARQLVDVRHEALNISKKAKKLFGSDAAKKSPEGAKKPLLMFVLMKKGKGAKKPMAEATSYCPRCGTSHTDSSHPKAKFGPMKGLFPRPTSPKEPESCPNCAAKRALGGGALTWRVEMPKKDKKSESLSRSGLNLVAESAHKFFPGRPDLAEKHGHKFLANMEKIRARAKARKSKAS